MLVSVCVAEGGRDSKDSRTEGRRFEEKKGSRKGWRREGREHGGRKGAMGEGRARREVKSSSQQSKTEASGYQGLRQKWRN